MASTAFTLYVKPSRFFPASAGRQSAFTAFVPVRITSGQFSTGLTKAKHKKDWHPSALTPVVDDKGLINSEWKRFFGYLANKKLGGPVYPTLPDLTQFITAAQAQSIFSAAISAATQQQANSNAQALAAAIEVLKTTGAVGAMQIPSVVLAPQETNAPTVVFIDNGSTGGGGGGD